MFKLRRVVYGESKVSGERGDLVRDCEVVWGPVPWQRVKVGSVACALCSDRVRRISLPPFGDFVVCRSGG